HHAVGVQQLIDRHVRRRLDRQPGHVARRARHGLVDLAQDDERWLARDAEVRKPADERLRLSVAHLDRLDRRQLPGGNLRRDGRAKRLTPHAARHVLLVAAGRGPKRLAATLPLHGPRGALARATGPLLLPGLAAAARNLAPTPGVVRAGATIG